MTTGTPLIASDEPAPYRVVNAHGSAPYLLVVDHASRTIPRALDDLGLDPTLLDRHIAWDIGAGALGERLARELDAPLVTCDYSRLIIDPNRHPDDPTSIPSISDGVPIPGNRDLSPEQARRRAETFFWPYHHAVEAALDRFRAAGRVPAVVSVHSFTPDLGGFERPWHIGVLSHLDRRVADPLLERLGSVPGLCVGDNQPYSARNPPGFSVEYHAESKGYPNALLEVRQDQLEHEEGVAWWTRALAAALREVLAPEDLYRVERFCDAPRAGFDRHRDTATDERG